MRTEIRKTAQGTEYWDNIEKRSVFVSVGKKPGFEVTENPKSMVHVEEKKKVEELDIDSMNLKQLKEHAASLEIELPKEAKTKAEVLKHIKGEEVVEEDEVL